MANKIDLGGFGAHVEDEGAADAAITPGDLIQRTSTGVKKHATAGGDGMPIFAEAALDQNKGIDDDYAQGDAVRLLICQAGKLVNARVAAAAEAIAVGDPLGSAGDGTLRKVTTAQATRAKVTIGTGNAAIEFEAAQPGNEGNDITVAYAAADSNTATVTVSGTAIVIKPDNSTPGTTDTANEVIDLVNESAEASALVVARATGTGASAVVTPVAATNLAGGMDAGANVIAYATETVDNSGEATAARIKAEVR